MYQFSKTYVELEKKAGESGIFFDFEVPSAVPGYVVVKCIACRENGSRCVRIASAESVYIAQERSGLMALSILFGQQLTKEDLTLFEDAGKTHMAGGESQPNRPHNGQTAAKATATNVAGQSGTTKLTAADAANKHNVSAANKNNTVPCETREADDFRVNISKYEHVEKNYISDLLKDDEGRKFLKMICSAPKPPTLFVDTIKQATSYLKKRNIVL